MKSISDDITIDGWMALCIAILRCVPQHEAFRLLYNPAIKRKWSEDDYLEIEELRKSGESWRNIGEMFGINKSNVFRQYQRWNEKKKKSR